MSGRLIVVAPASITAAHSSIKNSGSERPASSGENSMSSTRVLAKATILEEVSRHSWREMPSLCSRWMSEEARNVWIRCKGACFTAL